MSHKDYFSIKPIDEEVVTFADDFFFKLSDAQVLSKLEDLKKRQLYIYNIVNHFGSTVNPTCRDYILRTGLMVDYCYNKFYFPIPLISQQKVMDYVNFITEEGKAKIAAGNNKQDSNDDIALLNQHILAEAITEKLMYYEDTLHVVNNKENLLVGYNLHALLTLYNTEIILRQSIQN
jgi:hypothetical protein